MRVFVDTSCLYALLDESDRHHPTVADVWTDLVDNHQLITHSHVVIEASALVQTRLGWDAVDRLHTGLLAVVDVVMVDAPLHLASLERWRQARRRGLSLVDVTSFVFMSRDGIGTAFAVADDFAEAGFEVLPAG